MEYTKTLKERFESKIYYGLDGCWYWLGPLQPGKGYGIITVSKNGMGVKRTIGTHRISYLLFKGPIHGRLYVCHTCDNPSCVNPDHLFLGTHNDNMIDKVRKGRHRHKLTAAQVLEIRSSTKKSCDIQKLYHINSSTLHDIRRIKSWKHI